MNSDDGPIQLPVHAAFQLYLRLREEGQLHSNPVTISAFKFAQHKFSPTLSCTN